MNLHIFLTDASLKPALTTLRHVLVNTLKYRDFHFAFSTNITFSDSDRTLNCRFMTI